MPYREGLETVLKRCEALRTHAGELERALHRAADARFEGVRVGAAVARSTDEALEVEQALRSYVATLEREVELARERARLDAEAGLLPTPLAREQQEPEETAARRASLMAFVGLGAAIAAVTIAVAQVWGGSHRARWS